MFKKIICLQLFLCFAVTVEAQTEEYIFKNYDTQNGLCDNNINSIEEDYRGFIWIATKEGLSRFDGAEFRNVFNSGNYSCLHPIAPDRLLMTNNFKLSLLNTSTNELVTIKAFEKIQVIQITKLNSDLYALNAVNRFILIDSKLNKKYEIQIPGKIHNNIFIQKLTENKVLIGNCFEYYEYDLKAQKMKLFNLNMRQYQDDNYDLFELRFIDIQQQKIYINDFFTGLYIFDYKGKLLQHYHKNLSKNKISSSNIICYLKDANENLWIGTHGGINLFTKDKNLIISHRKENDLSLKSDVITCLFSDKNNNIWIGTNQGISVYKNKRNSKVGKISITNNQQDVFLNTLAFTEDEILTGEYLNKVYAVSATTHKVRSLNCSTKVWGLYNIGNSVVISGANPDKEVETYFPQTNTFAQTDFLKKHYPKTDLVTLVYQHSNGDFWYSGNAGGGFVRKIAHSNQTIAYYKDEKGKPLFKSSYYALAVEDADKNLWFGVNRSELLLQWNYKTKQFKEFNFDRQQGTNMILFGGITGLKIDRKNTIWISYEGGGIIKFNPKTKQVKQYSTANVLNTNIINDIELDAHDRLWILSSKGISCLDPKTEKFYLMDIWDGFAENPINYNTLKLNPKTETLWIAAVNNLYYLNPNDVLKSKRKTTNLYLDYLIINDEKPVNLSADRLEFNPNENNLEFRLVAVDIENGKNLEYSYKLDGLNKQWYNLATNRTVFFQKLKAGTYTFNARVRSKGNNDWVYLGKPITFTIANNWYETWWFFILFGIIILYGTFRIISFYFDRKLEKQQNELEKQRLIEEERKRIAKDMHDDLGSGLTKITYLSQMALQNKSNTEHVANINKTSIELVESMSEIIWVMKDENNSWEELLFFIKKYAVEYCGNNNLKVNFHYPDKLIAKELNGEKRRHIYLAVKEVLHNIVKHAQADEVVITVTQNTNTNLSISDNGIGFQTETNSSKNGGNGLKNIQERMKMIKGTVSIDSHNGTHIQFSIPN